MPIETIQFRDLKRQYQKLKNEIDQRINTVIASSRFINGPQVKELESVLAEYTGRKHCITCANGTDAISIALMAYGVGEGDAVFVPDFTFFSTGECPATLGATPVFVDVLPSTYNIDAQSLEKEIEKVIAEGALIPKAVIAVDLFGQPFDYSRIREVCDRYRLLLLEDAAQGFGGSYTLHKKTSVFNEEFKAGTALRACKLGQISATSFFPAKPFGCYGDGGAIFTDDDRVDKLCRSIAVHGKDTESLDDPNAKYNNVRLGMNSRLDTLQAAILLAKFPCFQNFELEKVNWAADIYTRQLSGIEGLKLPALEAGCFSSWAQYTIQLPSKVDRYKIQSKLNSQGIPTNIYYSKPMHKQRAFESTRSPIADCAVTEKLCSTVLCLPIHPYLEETEVEYIAKKVKDSIVEESSRSICKKL